MNCVVYRRRRSLRVLLRPAQFATPHLRTEYRLFQDFSGSATKMDNDLPSLNSVAPDLYENAEPPNNEEYLTVSWQRKKRCRAPHFLVLKVRPGRRRQ